MAKKKEDQQPEEPMSMNELIMDAMKRNRFTVLLNGKRNEKINELLRSAIASALFAADDANAFVDLLLSADQEGDQEGDQTSSKPKVASSSSKAKPTGQRGHRLTPKTPRSQGGA